MILTVPDFTLKQIAKPVVNFNTMELNALIAKMFSIMEAKDGVGLAAPQIGISLQIFVYGFSVCKRYPDAPPVPKGVAINPQILSVADDLIELEEGCLSVPGRRGLIKRNKAITFSAADATGERYEKTLYDFAARIVQHEIDHLNGILISDRASNLYDSVLI